VVLRADVLRRTPDLIWISRVFGLGVALDELPHRRPGGVSSTVRRRWRLLAIFYCAPCRDRSSTTTGPAPHRAASEPEERQPKNRERVLVDNGEFGGLESGVPLAPGQAGNLGS
jgi:hypothetical protein